MRAVLRTVYCVLLSQVSSPELLLQLVGDQLPALSLSLLSQRFSSSSHLRLLLQRRLLHLLHLLLELLLLRLQQDTKPGTEGDRQEDT